MTSAAGRNGAQVVYERKERKSHRKRKRAVDKKVFLTVERSLAHKLIT